MSYLQRNILSQLASGSVDSIAPEAIGSLLGLPAGLVTLISKLKPIMKGAAQTAVLNMYDDVRKRQISTIETKKVEYSFQKAENVFWDFVEKEGSENAGYSFDSYSPEYEGARQAAEGFLIQSMREFEHKKLDVLGSYFGRNLYYGNTQWEAIYQTQKMIERLTYRQIVLIRLISERFPGENQEEFITSYDACVETMDLINYGIWKAPGAFIGQDNSLPIPLKSLVPTKYAHKLRVELMLDDIPADVIKKVKTTLSIRQSENANDTLTIDEVSEMRDLKAWG